LAENILQKQKKEKMVKGFFGPKRSGITMKSVYQQKFLFCQNHQKLAPDPNRCLFEEIDLVERQLVLRLKEEGRPTATSSPRLELL
jgi:hypothetical protein